MTHTGDLLAHLDAHGLRDTPTERALAAALRSLSPLALAGAPWPGAFVLQYPQAGTHALILSATHPHDAAHLKDLAVRLGPAPLEVCLCGEDPTQRAQLDTLVGRALGRPATRMQLDNHGAAEALGSLPSTHPPLWNALSKLPPAGTHPDWPVLLAGRAEAEALVRAQTDELAAYARAMAGRRAPVTMALLAMVVAVFGVELWLGTGTPVWALRRLGALDTGRLLDGEWWRAVAATFLHGGPMHLLLNGMVLWTLGGSMERVMGSVRFVVVYGVAGLVGSAVSAWRLGPAGVSVGASGALWGLMAAQAALVFLKDGPLPAIQRARARSGVLQSLVVNAVVSFQPHVDWAAHLGGGLAGALFTLAGLGRQGPPRADRPEPAPHAALRVAAMVLGALYVGGLGVALWQADLPALVDRDAVQRVEVGGVSAEVPRVVASRRRVVSAEGQPAEGVVGDLEVDPMLLVLAGEPRDPVDAAALAVEAGEVADVLRARKDGELTDGPTVVPGEGGTLVHARHRLPNGLLFQSAVLLAPGHWLRTDVVTWPGDPMNGLAERVVRSARVLEKPAPVP